MGPFLYIYVSGTGINHEVSGGRWIRAVVLFTDDWLASQNHQIHLPTVTFITVIFKVTAACLVSQRWPPHICSHLLCRSRPVPLCIRLHPSIRCWEAAVLLFLFPLATFNQFCFSLPGKLRMTQGQGGAEKRQRREQTHDPDLFCCLTGAFWSAVPFALQESREIHFAPFPFCLSAKKKRSLQVQKRMRMKLQPITAAFTWLLSKMGGDIKIGGQGVLRCAFEAGV